MTASPSALSHQLFESSDLNIQPINLVAVLSKMSYSSSILGVAKSDISPRRRRPGMRQDLGHSWGSHVQGHHGTHTGWDE